MSDDDIRNQVQILVAESSRRNEARAEAENRPLVGRYFKTRNSYGSGRKWWLYKKVTGSKGAWLTCFQFQNMAGKRLEATTDDGLYGVEGYIEIKKSEWDKAWSEFKAKLIAANSP